MLYSLESEFIERYKVLGDPWPWKEDPKEWEILSRKSWKIYLTNVCILLPIFAYGPILHPAVDLKVDFSTDGVPSSLVMFAQVFFCMMCEDLVFHFSHRFLHWRRIYPYIHKIHHQHKSTVAIAAQHAHPLEFVLGNLLPTAVGVIILGSKIHCTVAFTWYILRSIESVEGHSGYEFSWSPFRMLPFASDYGYHAYHHSHNIGNYSSFFTIWDTVFGTNKIYQKYLREEARPKIEKLKKKA